MGKVVDSRRALPLVSGQAEPIPYYNIFRCSAAEYVDNKNRTSKERRGAMEITDIRVRKVIGGGKPKAYVTVTFDDCFVVHNIKIIEGKTGVFIAMPSRKTRAGEYKDVAHPIHPEFRAELQKRILEKYDSGDVMEATVDDHDA
jgi:stage V sporulation protein G